MKRLFFKTGMVVTVMVLFLGCFSLKADIWGQLAKGLINGANQAVQMKEQQMVQQILDNPARQSAEMKEYLEYIRTGNTYFAQGEYAAAWGAYRKANLLALNTSDYVLQLVYNKYGHKAELEQMLITCWNASGAGGESSYSSGSDSYYQGNSSNNTSGSSTTTKTCRKCHGKKVCPRCDGTGKVFSTTYAVNKYIVCPACSGSKKCTLCGGN